MRQSPACIAIALAALSGCGRYADFALPTLGPARALTWKVSSSTPPLLTRGAPGAWDAVDVLNPSVVFWSGRHFNLYSGFDGRSWRTGVATSADGVAWEKRGMVVEPEAGGYIAANGSALAFHGRLFYWYQSGRLPEIELAESADGLMWTKRDRPVLPTGPRGSFDERGVADPNVVSLGGVLYMFYLGQDRARRQRLGLARSEDGVAWEKLRRNPLLELGGPGEFDERGLGEPAVWTTAGWYWMLYTGRDVHEVRRIGLARSPDGVHWTKLGVIFEGHDGWNSKVVCDPSVIARGGEVRVWYGGGDVARPDERIEGQIAMFTLTAEPAQ